MFSGPMISLLIVVALGLLITRIGTVALTFTGLSRELARFQARSAFTGVGYTTKESEHILDHPVRRRIIMLLMLLGNAGIVASITALVPVFMQEEEGTTFTHKLLVLGSGLLLIWAISISPWIDKRLSQLIEWALKRWTKLDVWDYPGLLRLSAGYSVCEISVESGDWLAGKTLATVRLGDEGVQVLGIRRINADYIGAPMGTTFFRAGDDLVVYGKSQLVAELNSRRAGTEGDQAHEERVAEVQQDLEHDISEQQAYELRRAQRKAALESKDAST